MKNLRYFLLPLALLLPLKAQNCVSGAPTSLGAVVPLSVCSSSGMPGTSCQQLRVECTGIPPIEVRVRVHEPDAGVPLRGTVVFGVGGGGMGFYGQRVGGSEIFTALRARGFRVVDRSWLSSWFGDPVSVRKQSCRYATLLTWIHANVHGGGVFCASGNSGGSAEIGYALSTWGRDAILDCAVPTGGPPMTRLDLLCQDPVGNSWAQLCASVVPDPVMNCAQIQCSVPATHPVCNGCSNTPTPQDLRADSILFPGATTHYPTTRVHQIIGTRDCSSAMPAGILFHHALSSEKILEYADEAPHWVAENAAGQDAIVRAILSAGNCPNGPATLSWTTPPLVGGSVDLMLEGPPGEAYLLALSSTGTQLEVLPFGWLYLGEPILLLSEGTLDSISGAASVVFPLPADPALQGVEGYLQALLGSCLSNLLRVEVY